MLHAEQLADGRLRARRVGAGQRRERQRKPSTASAWPVADEVAGLGEREAVVGEAARLDRLAARRRRRRRSCCSSPCRRARSRASCARARQPSCSRPTRQSSGTNTSSKNTSLNIAWPVSSRSGRMSMPGRLHVDHEARDAVVLRPLGVGARQADAPVGLLGHRRPHLLAVQQPAAFDARRPRRERREVGAGARLAEELAPADLAAQRRHDPALLLLRRCRSTIRFGSAHAPTPMFGRVHLGGAELLVDHEQLERLGVAAPRRGPAGREVARLGEAVALLAARSRSFELVEERAELGADAPRLPGRGRRRAGGARRASQPRAARTRQSSGVPVELVQRHRAPEVEVRVVLPGEADAAERLHAVLARSRTRRRTRARPRPRSRAPPPVSVSSAARGRVPHRGAGELGARQHLGAAVLHALELADRPAELHAHLRVLGRGVDAPLRDADRLGREQRRREHRGRARSVRLASCVGRSATAAPSTSMRATRRVRSMLLTSRRADRGRRRARTSVAVDARTTIDVGDARRRHRTSVAPSQRDRGRCSSPVSASVATQPARSRRALAPPSASASIAATIAVGTYGPGAQRAAELLDHDGLLDERRTRSRRAPRRRGDRCQPGSRERVPERRAAPARRPSTRRATTAGRDVVVDEAPDRRAAGARALR